MDEQNIAEILQIILDNIKGKNVVWVIDGSANLKIQGVEVTVNDLDITTNDKGINVFRNVLQQYVVEDFFSQKIKGRSLICKINNFKIEINSYGDREFEVFDNVKEVLWYDLKIPVLTLRYARRFYGAINRDDKVKLISRHL